MLGFYRLRAVSTGGPTFSLTAGAVFAGGAAALAALALRGGGARAARAAQERAWLGGAWEAEGAGRAADAPLSVLVEAASCRAFTTTAGSSTGGSAVTSGPCCSLSLFKTIPEPPAGMPLVFGTGIV